MVILSKFLSFEVSQQGLTMFVFALYLKKVFVSLSLIHKKEVPIGPLLISELIKFVFYRKIIAFLIQDFLMYTGSH